MKINSFFINRKRLFLIMAFTFTFAIASVIAGRWLLSSSAQVTPNYSSLEPKDVVSLYWSASLSGDSVTLKELITTVTPESFNRECPIPEGANQVASEPKFEWRENNSETRKPETKSLPKLFGKIEKDSIPDTIYHTSHYIYVNQRPLAAYENTRQSEYGDEAFLEITPLVNPQDYSTSVFFLKKEPTGWKIFTIFNKNMLNLIGNQKFGKERQCK